MPDESDALYCNSLVVNGRNILSCDLFVIGGGIVAMEEMCGGITLGIGVVDDTVVVVTVVEVLTIGDDVPLGTETPPDAAGVPKGGWVCSCEKGNI
jgi:hypothetical protein